jgi:hypothetical protein
MMTVGSRLTVPDGMTAGQVQRIDFGDPATTIAIDKAHASASCLASGRYNGD